MKWYFNGIKLFLHRVFEGAGGLRGAACWGEAVPAPSLRPGAAMARGAEGGAAPPSPAGRCGSEGGRGRVLVPVPVPAGPREPGGGAESPAWAAACGAAIAGAPWRSGAPCRRGARCCTSWWWASTTRRAARWGGVPLPSAMLWGRVLGWFFSLCLGAVGAGGAACVTLLNARARRGAGWGPERGSPTALPTHTLHRPIQAPHRPRRPRGPGRAGGCRATRPLSRQFGASTCFLQLFLLFFTLNSCANFMWRLGGDWNCDTYCKSYPFNAFIVRCLKGLKKKKSSLPPFAGSPGLWYRFELVE